MAILTDDQREDILDFYRQSITDAVENGETREEAIDTATTALSDSEYGDIFDDAWDEDTELREGMTNINTSIKEDFFDAYGREYDDDEDYGD